MPAYGDPGAVYGAAAGTYGNLSATALGPFPNAANPAAVIGRGLHFYGKNFGPLAPRRFVGATRVNALVMGAAPQARTGPTDTAAFGVVAQDPSALFNPATNEVTVDKAGAWTFSFNGWFTWAPAGVKHFAVDLAVNGVPRTNVGDFTTDAAANEGGFVVDPNGDEIQRPYYRFAPSSPWCDGQPHDFTGPLRTLILDAGDKVTVRITWDAGITLIQSFLWFNAAVDLDPAALGGFSISC